MFKLVYVFDYRTTTGHVCRVPMFVARALCRMRPMKTWDYSASINGDDWFTGAP